MDLVALYRQKFLTALRSVKPLERWKLVVVDETSKNMLGRVFNLLDLNEEDVTLIEAIENQRQPFLNLEAIYLIMPTKKNLMYIEQDLNSLGGRVEGGGSLYKSIHLFFLSAINDSLFDSLAKMPGSKGINSLKELYMDFSPFDNFTFTLDITKTTSFYNLYSPYSNQNIIIESLDLIASKMVSIFASLNQFPIIRYHKNSKEPNESLGLTKMLSQLLFNKLEEYFEADEELENKAESDKLQLHNVPSYLENRPILLLLDRGFDLMAPFLLDFSYQALANDLLPIEQGIYYSYVQDNKDRGLLNEVKLDGDDKIWSELRFKEITECAREVRSAYQKLLQTSQAAAKYILGKDKHEVKEKAELKELKEAVRELPRVKATQKLYQKHSHITEKCIKLFRSRSLQLISMIQQDLACGSNLDGDPLTIKEEKELLQCLVQLLTDKAIRFEDKARTLALYLLAHKDPISYHNRYRLEKAGSLINTQFSSGLSNIPYLNGRHLAQEEEIFLQIKSDEVKPLLNDNLKAYEKPIGTFAKRLDNNTSHLNLIRYIPKLKHVLCHLQNNSLSYTDFPLLNKPLSPYNSDTKSMEVKPSQHILAFVIGGITFSEIKEVNLLNSLNKGNREAGVMLGSTNIITQDNFLDSLSKLSSSTPK